MMMCFAVFFVMTLMCCTVQSYCDPCICLPMDHPPRYLICQGHHIENYPKMLSEYEKRLLEEIYIVDTWIDCLPAIDPIEYCSLWKFGESGNISMNCTCLLTWYQIVQGENFTSVACDNMSMSTSLSSPLSLSSSPLVTTSTALHTSSSNVVTTDDDDDSQSRRSSSTSCCAPPGGDITTPLEGPGPSTPEPDSCGGGGATAAAVGMGICLLIVLTLSLFIGVRRRCHIWRKRRSVGDGTIPLQVLNYDYDMWNAHLQSDSVDEV